MTEAGARLIGSIGLRFDEIESEISALSALRAKPAGTVRITTVEHAAETILWPAMAKLMREYPDINIELINDYGLTDIVAQRCDAGVRFGEQVDRDMIAVRIGRDFRIAVVAAPSYFHGRRQPRTPQDLTEHASSIFASPRMGASMFGNSGRPAVNSKSVSGGGPCSMPWP